MFKKLSLALLLILFMVSSAFAGALFVYPKFQGFDDNGDPLSGGKLYTYVPTSTTNKATYSDRLLTVPNTNPLILDARGEGVVYGAGQYKFVLNDVDDNLIWTFDYVDGIGGYLGGNYYFPDASQADQGVAVGSVTVKDFVDSIAVTAKATIAFSRGNTGNTTDYTFLTSETIPSNITLKFEPGARVSIAVGETLTINGPFEAGLYQVFTGAGSVVGGVSTTTRTIYPEWWGAQADDLNTSATLNGSAIESAVDYLNAAGGGILKFSNGTYKWGGDRSTPEYITFLGNGVDQTILELYDDGLLSNIPTTSKLSPGAGGNVTLENITFNNDAFIRADDVRILWSIDKDNIVIKNCKFICRNHPITITGGSGVKILDNLFVNSASPGSPAISIGGGTDDVIVRGNFFEAATLLQAGGNSMASVNLNGGTNVRITENYIEGSQKAGIVIENATSDGVLVSDNIIDISGNTEIGVMYGIYIQHALSTQVSNNRIIGNKTHASNTGIEVQLLAASGISEKIITDNYIEGFKSGIVVWETAGGAYSVLDNLSIRNNTFDNIDTDGIRLRAENVAGAKDYLINIDGNEFHNSPSIRISTTADAGEIIITDNILGTGSGYIRILSGSPPMTLGANNNTAVVTTVQLYDTFSLWALPSADFDDIQFLDKKVYVSTPIDLSGGATTIRVYDSDVRRLATRVDLIYTEGSSIDAGVDIVLRYIGTAAASNIFLTSTSEVSKALHYIKTFYAPDLHSNSQVVNAIRPYYEIHCAGGKVGTGEIVVRIEYVESFGPYS